MSCLDSALPIRRLMWRVRLILSVALLLTLPIGTPAFALGVQDSVPTLTLEPCTVQGVKAECGTLSVHENRIAPSGRKIPVYVVVVRAREQQAESTNAMFFFAGGPGGAASGLVGLYSRLWYRYNRTGDLVFVDQRGVGQSNPLKCQLDQELNVEDNVAACLKALDADPSMYTTAMYTDDVDDVRRALGYDQISIYGGSYGGTVVQVYLIRHGEQVRSAIMDHTTLVTIPFFSALARNSQFALNNLFARCEADKMCKEAYPDLQKEWDELQRKVTDKPVTTDVLHPFTRKPIVIDHTALAASVHLFLFSTEQTVNLPLAIHIAHAHSDFTAFARMQVEAAYAREASVGLVMYGVIMCTEPWSGSATPLDEIRRLGAGSYYLGAALANMAEYNASCPLLPRGAASQYGQPIVRELPVLVLVGDLDPQNPLDNMKGVNDWYPQAQVIIEPGQGHASLNTRCRTDLMNHFAIDASRPADTSCLEMGLPLFARR